MSAFSFTAPRITAEEEQAERDALSDSERQEIHRDMYGSLPTTTKGPDMENKDDNDDSSNDNNDNNDDATTMTKTESSREGNPLELLQRRIKAVHEFIADEISDGDKSAYMEAVQIAPDIVASESSVELFLFFASESRRDAVNGKTDIVRQAAHQLIGYWKMRYDVFQGATRALQPMTILPGGVMHPYLPQLQRGFIFPLPPDYAGRTVVYMDRIRAVQCESPRDVISCCTFYVHYVVAREQYRKYQQQQQQQQQRQQQREDDEPSISHKLCTGSRIQPQGYVMLCNMRGFDLYKHHDRILLKRFFHMIQQNACPIRALHFVSGTGRSVLELVMPMLKQVIGRYARLRMQVVSGSNREVEKTLEPFGLGPVHVAEAFGGEIRNRATAAEWLKEHYANEMALLSLLPPLPATITTTTIRMAAAVAAREDEPNNNNSSSRNCSLPITEPERCSPVETCATNSTTTSRDSLGGDDGGE